MNYYDKAKKIDVILRFPHLFRKLYLLLLIFNDKSCENYFFEKVSSLEWFSFLKFIGYFSPARAPAPIKDVQEGFLKVSQWNVSPYLERVSQQVAIEGNEKYIDGLLKIINSVTKYHIEHDKKLDNYRTWWYFVKILLNIPNDKIVKCLKEHNIKIGQDWIKEWITSKFDSSLPASDIATKLLPKFLTGQGVDKEIAEDIIQVITAIKWEFLTGERVKLYGKKVEPKTVVNHYWLIESFKKNAIKIGESCSENVIYDLANKLKEIFKREHESHQIDIEWQDETYRIKAVRARDKDSNLTDFDFRCFVGKLKKSDLEKGNVKNSIFKLLSLEPEALFDFELIDCQSKETFMVRTKQGLSETGRPLDLTKSVDLEKKLDNLYEGLYSDYSYIWFKSFASGLRVGIHNANEVLTAILRDILLAKCKSNTKVGKTILGKFLGKEYQFPLFRRFVLFAVNVNWAEYKDSCWKFLEDNPEAFNDSDYEAELYKLLQSNVVQLRDVEKKRIEKLISKGPRYIPDEKQEHYIAYWKQKWYSAIQKDPYFSKLYEKQKKITEIEKVEPPSEKPFVEVRLGEETSSLSKEDILKMNNANLVKYLNEFKAKDSWKRPTMGGLAEVLKAAVKEKPDRFVDDLSSFLSVNYLYVYNIFYGLEDTWKEKRSFDWGKLFNFAKEYINKPVFWEDAKRAQGEDWLVTHVWIINVIADLIQEGTRDDSWAFAEDYFSQAEELLDMIIEKLPVKRKESSRDAVIETLNTSYGRVIIAMILLSLRKARVEDKKGIKKEIRWEPVKYENLIEKGIIEAFTLFGQYMPNFTYLNKSWVEEKIEEFESFPKDDIRWQSFMEGYLFGYRIYQDLYGLMRSHYIRGIEKDFGKSPTENRLVQHITIGYLRGNESLEGQDSLFKRIMDKWDHSQIGEIVNFFWSQAQYLKEEAKQESEEDKRVKDRIIEFWRWTYENRNVVKDKLKKDYKEVLSGLARLTILLDKIDLESSKWLLLSAPCASNSSFFIKYLNKFEDKESIRFIGKIFLEMLSAITPDYNQEHIISIVKKIYKFGNRTEADKICNVYGSRGCEFLRPIYEEHNEN